MLTVATSPAPFGKFVLDRFPQEQIMEFYLGVPVTSRSFCSPFYADSRPSAGYFYRNGKLFVKDHRGYFYGDCFDVVAKMRNVSLSEAPSVILSEMGGEARKEYSPEFIERLKKEIGKKDSGRAICWTRIPWNKDAYDFWTRSGHTFYCDISTREVRSDILDRYEVDNASHVWIGSEEYPGLRASSGNPTFVYRIWTPLGDSVKTYKPRGDKKYKWRSASTGSPMYQGLKQMDWTKRIMAISSLKDAMTAIILSEERISAYGMPSEGSNAPLLQGTEFYFADRDWPGMRYAVKLRKSFPGLKVVMVPKEAKCKDLTEWAEKDYRSAKFFIDSLLSKQLI